jgi:hypothetical protein
MIDSLNHGCVVRWRETRTLVSFILGGDHVQGQIKIATRGFRVWVHDVCAVRGERFSESRSQGPFFIYSIFLRGRATTGFSFFLVLIT